jgi:general secretion pathway protein G
MNRSIRRHSAQGFTLIELLIVVIIIAILAAIAIPQFANTSNDAQTSALSANLSTMRSAIELYRVQHKNVYPSVAASNAAVDTCTGTKGSAAANDPAAFTQQLTMFSDSVGNTCSVHVDKFIYGPYLRAIPMEQISNPAKNDVVIISSNAQDPAPSDTTGGYQFDNRTGRLVMNSNAKDQRGVVYSTY